MCAPRYVANIGLTLAALLGTGSCSSEVKDRSKSAIKRDFMNELCQIVGRKNKPKMNVPKITTISEFTEPQEDTDQRAEGTPKGCDSGSQEYEDPVPEISIRERKNLPHGLPRPGGLPRPAPGMYTMSMTESIDKAISIREKKGLSVGLPPPNAGVPPPKKVNELQKHQQGQVQHCPEPDQTRSRSKAIRRKPYCPQPVEERPVFQKGTRVVIQHNEQRHLDILLIFLGWKYTVDADAALDLRTLFFFVKGKNKTLGKRIVLEFDLEDNVVVYKVSTQDGDFYGGHFNKVNESVAGPAVAKVCEETTFYWFKDNVVGSLVNGYKCPDEDQL